MVEHSFASLHKSVPWEFLTSLMCSYPLIQDLRILFPKYFCDFLALWLAIWSFVSLYVHNFLINRAITLFCGLFWGLQRIIYLQHLKHWLAQTKCGGGCFLIINQSIPESRLQSHGVIQVFVQLCPQSDNNKLLNIFLPILWFLQAEPVTIPLQIHP